MRKYLHIQLDDQTVSEEEQEGQALVKIGRYLIAKTLLERGATAVDPLSPANPLIFSAGPIAGTEVLVIYDQLWARLYLAQMDKI